MTPEDPLEEAYDDGRFIAYIVLAGCVALGAMCVSAFWTFILAVLVASVVGGVAAVRWWINLPPTDQYANYDD